MSRTVLPTFRTPTRFPRVAKAMILTVDQLKKGCEAFHLHEPRDAMYKTAAFLVNHFWGRPADMADSLGVLLLTWNQAHYRYGSFDFGKLEICIGENLTILESYRPKNILDYTESDEPQIRALFRAFLLALTIAEGSSAGKQSPVATAKALHLLASDFFPLWDKKIAMAYGCDYSQSSTDKYIEFIKISQDVVRTLQSVLPPAGKTILKQIDEYNYAKYTKGWI